MKKLQQLREQRDAKAREANAINAATPGDKAMPKEDAVKMDALLLEIEGIDADIARVQKVAALNIEQDPEAAHEAALNAATRNAPVAATEEGKALRAFLTGGLSAMTPEHRQMVHARQSPDIRAAMSSNTSTEGGYTTATEYIRQLEVAMKAYGGIRAVARILPTQNGSQILWPTADATSEEGELVGQNAPASEGNTAFGTASLDVYKFSSKKIALPFELLQDTFVDIEAYIRELLATRLGRVTSRYATTGTGVNQPRGIVTGATLGKAGANGQTVTVTYDDLVDLEHSVDPAYRSNPGVGFMMHDMSLKAVRKIKDSQNRPIFVPGYEQGNPGGAPDRLLNRPIFISQEMDQMAANAKSILFGDYQKHIIRDVMDLTLFRMTDSAFTLLGQVGFVAFMRMGSNTVDVGGAIRYYQNSAA